MTVRPTVAATEGRSLSVKAAAHRDRSGRTCASSRGQPGASCDWSSTSSSGDSRSVAAQRRQDAPRCCGAPSPARSCSRSDRGVWRACALKRRLGAHLRPRARQRPRRSRRRTRQIFPLAGAARSTTVTSAPPCRRSQPLDAAMPVSAKWPSVVRLAEVQLEAVRPSGRSGSSMTPALLTSTSILGGDAGGELSHRGEVGRSGAGPAAEPRLRPAAASPRVMSAYRERPRRPRARRARARPGSRSRCWRRVTHDAAAGLRQCDVPRGPGAHSPGAHPSRSRVARDIALTTRS